MDYIPPRPAPPRGAIAIVTFAGWDAVDAGDAASRGSWGNVCLRAGRICASTATGKETAGLRMDRPLDSVTDDQVETRSAYSLEAPFPSPWDFNSRSERSSRQSASNRKNTAGGTSGNRSAPPKVLMHTTLRKTAFASGPRVQRAPGVPHALSQGAGNATDDGAPAPQTMGAMTHV